MYRVNLWSIKNVLEIKSVIHQVIKSKFLKKLFQDGNDNDANFIN